MRAAYLYGTVLYDEQEKVYKMWYQTFHPSLKTAYILYATSTNGTRWEKPELGLVDWHGSKRNNILMQGEIGTVVKDISPSNPARLYKMFAFLRPDYDVFFSPDGLHWTHGEKEYALCGGDVANAGRDPYQNDYYVLVKLPHPAGRAAFLSRSRDFENWTTGVPVMVADGRDQDLAKFEGAKKMEIYGMSAAPYEGAYIGFPWMFRITGKGGKGTGGDGQIDVQFAFSRDLIHWARPIRDAIIPNGIAGSFDDEMVFTSSAPVIRDDEIDMFYGAWDGPHVTFDRTAYVGRARWKPDRFVSISNGGFTSGTLCTRPVLLDGTALMVNCDMVRGSLAAELLDETGRVLPGYGANNSISVTGDQMHAELCWRGKNGVKELAGRNVRIRFFLLGGDLFSFWQKGQ
jgi:hypothetical protein